MDGHNAETNDTMKEGQTVASKFLIATILYTITACAIAGNLLVIVAVLSLRRLRSSITNYFIVSLASADLMVALFVMPFNASFEILGYWPFGLVFCDVYQAVDILSATASILNLCVISLDRFMAITSPFSYYTRMNNRTAAGLITTVWVVSFLISALPVTLNLHEDQTLKATGWYSDPLFCVLAMNSTFALVSSIISFYIPAAIILFTYARIYVVARRQARQIAAQDDSTRLNSKEGRTTRKNMMKERKAAKTLAIIVGVFIACWLPFFVVNIIDPYCGHCTPPILFTALVWLGYLNSFLNPLIYAQNKTFRIAFKSVLCCYQYRDISVRNLESSCGLERTGVSRCDSARLPHSYPGGGGGGGPNGAYNNSLSDASAVYAVTNGALPTALAESDTADTRKSTGWKEHPQDQDDDDEDANPVKEGHAMGDLVKNESTNNAQEHDDTTI